VSISHKRYACDAFEYLYNGMASLRVATRQLESGVNQKDLADLRRSCGIPAGRF